MNRIPERIIIHPLLLLSIVDHYSRVAKDTNKRVVGILLGSKYKKRVDITNSYAVPFEEDTKDPNVWFLDHNYHERMWSMFRKVNAKEKVVGWYSTGPQIRPNDININEVILKYTNTPVYVIVEANPSDELSLPCKAYCAIDKFDEREQSNRRTFHHIKSEIDASDVEEIGVEHLLRDIRDTTVTSVTKNLTSKLLALRQMESKLKEVNDYLTSVIDGKLPANQTILSHLQEVFNLIPNLRIEEVVKSFAVSTNDMMLSMYLAALIRSIISLHDLINNKRKNIELENKNKEKNQQIDDKKEKKEEEEKNEPEDKEKNKDKNKDKNKN